MVAEERLRPSQRPRSSARVAVLPRKIWIDYFGMTPDDPEIFEPEDVEVDPDLAEYSPSEPDENFAYDYPSGDIAMPGATEDDIPMHLVPAILMNYYRPSTVVLRATDLYLAEYVERSLRGSPTLP